MFIIIKSFISFGLNFLSFQKTKKQLFKKFFLLLLLTYWVLTEIAVCVVGKKVDEFEENFEIVR